MLTAIIASLAALQPSTAPRQQPPDMSHMMREGMINPLRATHTVEWICARNGKPSRITIMVEDAGVGPRNSRFKIKLVHLLVDGRNPTPRTHQKLKSLLAGLNNITVFEGRCRQSTPGMLITGNAHEDGGKPPKTFLFDLR